MNNLAKDLIKKIEDNYPVDLWEIEGVHVWPIFRIFNFFNIESTTDLKNNIYEEFTFNQNIDVLPNLSTIVETETVIDAMILSDAVYRVSLNSLWYNRLSDPFYETLTKLGYSAINLDFSNVGMYKFPVIENTYSIRNQIGISEHFLGTQEELKICLPYFEEIYEEFCRYYNKDHILTINELIISTLFILKMKQYFKEVLIRKKTKVVFIVNFYQLISFALILAAKELSILSVDIQHGNQRYVTYSSWTKIPENGYNTLPSIFWNWYEKDSIPIQGWTKSTNHHDTLIGGNPWIELWKDNNSKIVNQFNNYVIDDKKVNILITLQPLYALVGWEENIPSWLIDVIEKSPSNYKFYIRYHQQMLSKFKNEMDTCELLLSKVIAKGIVETKKTTELPLPWLLKRMDIHITSFSTCVIEAKEFDIPSITLHEKAILYFEQEIRQGWVKQASNSDEVLESIVLQLQFKQELRENTKSNYSEIFSHKIQSIMDRQTNLKLPSDINSKILYEFYYSDGLYNKIIEMHKKNPQIENSLIVAKAYYKLKNEKEMIKAFNLFVEHFKIESKINQIDINDLIVVMDFFKEFNRIEKVNLCKSFIIKVYQKNTIYSSVILNKLFKMDQHQLLIDLILLNKEKSLDELYYGGRSLLKIKKNSDAISFFKEYLILYSSKNFKGHSDISKKNYLISTYFYLGEYYFLEKMYKEAEEYFLMCEKLTSGNHNKAKFYLKNIRIFNEAKLKK